MGRPREFELDEALERAMHVFWAKGYDGASLDDLLAAMEIGRGSLYKAFGDKRSLYHATLQHYNASVVDDGVRSLRDPRGGDVRTRIARMFHSVVDAVEQHGDRKGCFLCNASIDQAPHDPAVAAAVRRSLDRVEAALGDALAAIAAKEETEAEVTARARQLTAEYLGLRVLSKIGGDIGRLRALADAIVARI